MSKPRIIVCGAAGLVGQNLVARLRRSGYEDIVGLDKHAHNTKVLAQLHPDIEVECADLAESGQWERHFTAECTVVMLQAQIGGVRESEFERNCVRSTERILETMRRVNCSRLVHISSSVVNSAADDFYTRGKSRQEALVAESGFPHAALRPTLMFGWFDRKHLGWLSRFMRKVPVFPIPGSGRYTRQPLYVQDFCQIILRCIEDPNITGAYNISGLEHIDYIDIIREIKRATASKTPLLKIPYSLFYCLLWIWALFDRDPPFTTRQLQALVIPETFEIIDWPGIFDVKATPFSEALKETFQDPVYSQIELEF